MTDYFTHANLLNAPNNRAAYSDRTSYLMAEMSRLAYFRFEGGNNIDELIAQVKELLPEDGKAKLVEALIRARMPANDATQSRQALADILAVRGFALVETFCEDSTGAQAFLCRSADRDMAVLAFRGTEKSLKDIKADVKARLQDVDVDGRTATMHAGYYGQFISIKDRLKAALARPELGGSQLFITGHSLGGALAIAATKFLATDTTAACYTFGSPPVGTGDFDCDIRVPIYRIVNHVDIVPRLPNPVLVYAVRGLAYLIGILLAPFTGLSAGIRESQWYRSLKQTLLDAQKYRQCGYGSYLVGDGASVRLRYSVGTTDKLYWWSKQIPKIGQGEFDFIGDHCIQTYSDKLAAWAETRQ